MTDPSPVNVLKTFFHEMLENMNKENNSAMIENSRTRNVQCDKNKGYFFILKASVNFVDLFTLFTSVSLTTTDSKC